jgi:arylsulfatase A-like enzyme
MKKATLSSLAILTLAGNCVFSAPADSPARPNIVFILIDDMGWADGACFGSKFYQTPQMNALAKSGVRFTSAYAACAVCSPTRAALMTGKYPARLHLTDWIGGESAPTNSRFKLPDWQKHLPLEETTLATALKKLGYTTAHIGKWHLGGEKYFPQHQGFDTNIAGGDIGNPASYFWPYGAPNNDHRVPGLAERGGQKGAYLTDQLTDEALNFIEANKDKPFYLNFCHYAVHSPLMGKQELIDEAADRPGADGQNNKVYYAMLRSVDESVGRIVKKLDELHLTENTIIVFTSDNGGAVQLGKPPATSNFPLRNGKGTAYEGGLRVPLLVKVPGVTHAGTVCDTPVITMDWFPTLLELAGAEKSASRTAVDGTSIVPLLRGENETPHNELFWHYPHYWNVGKTSPYSVARVGDWKLIRFYETGTEELYNLKSDLSENNNLSESNPEKRKELSARLDAWLKEVGAQMPVPKATTDAQADAMAPLDLGALMQPYDPAISAFADEGYSCWDPQINKGEDGRYYLVYSRWLKRGGDWLTNSEICLAVADHAEGPYQHLKVLLNGRGPSHWDELMACNPKIKKLGAKYYLYYISSKPGPSRGYIRDSQRSSVAVSAALTGPYVPLDQPIVEPAAPVYNLTVNPTVERMPDGRFLMMVKGDLNPKTPEEPMRQRVQGLAIADSPTGPFQIQPELAIKDIDTEDADLWWDAARKKYFALFYAANYVGLIESADGLHWERAEHYKVCGHELLRIDGSWLKTRAPLQWPSLYCENGEPRVLCLAVPEPGHWHVVMVPLQKTGAQMPGTSKPGDE